MYSVNVYDKCSLKKEFFHLVNKNIAAVMRFNSENVKY